jgi:hypothetical protein
LLEVRLRDKSLLMLLECSGLRSSVLVRISY